MRIFFCIILFYFAQSAVAQMAAEDVFPSNPALAQTNVDSIQLSKDLYAKPKAYFLSNYASDAADSSLIKLYFKKRKKAAIGFLLTYLISIPVGAVTQVELYNRTTVTANSVSSVSLSVSPIALPANIIALTALIATRAKYSRHDLYCYLHGEANLPEPIRTSLLKEMTLSRKLQTP